MFGEVTAVAGVEPAVWVDNFLGKFWVLVVTHHHVVAAAHYLVGVRVYLYFDAWQRETYSTYFASVFLAAANRNNR